MAGQLKVEEQVFASLEHLISQTSITYRVKQTTRAGCIAIVRSLMDVQIICNPLFRPHIHIPVLYIRYSIHISNTKIRENYFQLSETPLNGACKGVEVGFGNFSCVKVGRAISHSKGLCIYTILVKTLFNYCHLGYPTM